MVSWEGEGGHRWHLQISEVEEGEPELRWGEVGVAGGHFLPEGVLRDVSEGEEQEQTLPWVEEGGGLGPLPYYSEPPLDGRGVGGLGGPCETVQVAC